MDGRPAPPFGGLLRRYRSRAQLTQEQVAERAQVSERTIRNLERGAPHAPRDDTLHLLAAALDLSEEERATFVTAGQALQALHARDTSLHLGTIGSGRLPYPPTPLFGRERELLQITATLASGDVRLLTLVGAPGVGKTRLALAVSSALADRADCFANGVAFVPLAPLADPGLVLGAILQALGLREQGDTPTLAVLQAGLTGRQVLLVLDNFEHLLASAPQLADLLAVCSGLTLLVTSRAPLRLRGEQVFEAPPLALPAAHYTGADQLPLDALGAVASVALFVERAQALRPEFALTPINAVAVATICRRLDGLPLALELAAAQLRLLTPQALLTRLDNTSALLSDGPRDLPERQRTLWATLEWSHGLLSPQEQRVFCRLAVCAGGCTLEAAEAICGAAVLDNRAEQSGGTEEDVLQALLLLVDHHLLQRIELMGWDAQEGRSDEVSYDEGGEVRIAMLETIRAYAWERLRASGDEGATRSSHAAYFRTFAEMAVAHLRGPQQAIWLARLERELDNLRAVLTWTLEQAELGDVAEIEHGVRLVAALWPFWAVRGHLHEGSEWLARALTLAERIVDLEKWKRSTIGTAYTSPMAEDAGERDAAQGSGQQPTYLHAYAAALRGAAVLALRRDDQAQAAIFADKALVAYRMLGDRAGTAATLGVLGGVEVGCGNLAGAEALWEESLTLARKVGEPGPIALALMNLGNIAHYRGDDARAAALQEESLPFFRAAGDLGRLATALNNLAGALYLRGALVRAGELWEEALALARSAGNVGATALTLANLGSLARQQSDYARAELLVRESIALHEDLGDQRHAAESLGLLGAVACDMGEFERAEALLQEALDMYRMLGFTEGVADALAELGRAARGRASWGEAIALYRDSLATYQRVESQPGLAAVLEGLSAALLHGGQASLAELAVRACGAATTLRKRGGEPRPLAEHTEYERTLALGHEAMDKERFAVAWAAGEQLTARQAIAEALEILAEELPGEEDESEK